MDDSKRVEILLYRSNIIVGPPTATRKALRTTSLSVSPYFPELPSSCIKREVLWCSSNTCGMREIYDAG